MLFNIFLRAGEKIRTMILLALNHTLHLQFDKSLQYIEETFVSTAQYVLYGDELVALGTEYSLCMSFSDCGLYTEAGAADLELPMECMIVKEDTAEEQLLKYIYMIFRRWHGILPYADDYMHDELLKKLNKRIAYYNLKIFVQGDLFEIYYENDKITLENTFFVMMQKEKHNEGIQTLRSDFEEAERYRNLGRHHDALFYYTKVIANEQQDSIIYTEASFGLGEVYYFEDLLEESEKAYMQCNVPLLTDAEDFYKRLGHTFVDEKMKDYTDDLKCYYRSILSVQYAEKHKDVLEKISVEVKEMFTEYEETCIEVGKEKYNKRKL